MASTSLIKNTLYKSLAEGVFKDVVTRTSSFYYFFGKTVKWDNTDTTVEDPDTPTNPVDSFKYERDVRNEIITAKEIKPSDVAFVVPRINWVADIVYDMYDDQYSDQVLGINVQNGGLGYINADDITVTITGGGGSGATAKVATLASGGKIDKIILTSAGSGYTSAPTVTVNGGGVASTSPNAAVLTAVVNIAASGAQRIEDARFYVVTDEFNVYKCLDNNNGIRSKYKPTGTQLEPITTLDGYIWKYMYNIPINLRNKFFTDDYMPVVSALSNRFYTNGTIDNIFISNRGKGYTSAEVSVTGDGRSELEATLVNSASISSEVAGSGYINPRLTFDPPVTTSTTFVPGNGVSLGQYIGTLPISYIKTAEGIAGEYTITVSDLTDIEEGLIVVHEKVTDNAAIKRIVSEQVGNTTVNTLYLTRPVIQNFSGEITVVANHTGDDYYLVTAPGILSEAPPTHKSGTALNGTAALKYIGTSLKGYLSTNNNKNIVKINLTSPGAGFLRAPNVTIADPTGTGAVAQAIIPTVKLKETTHMVSINGVEYPTSDGLEITNPGTGYTAPIVEISGGGGTLSTATAILTGANVLSIDVATGGSGYTNPKVYVGVSDAVSWTASTTLTTGDLIKTSTNKYYAVVYGGQTSVNEPYHTQEEHTAPNLQIAVEYFISSVGTTNWNTVAGTTGITYSVGDRIIVQAVGTGDGKAITNTKTNGFALLKYLEVTSTTGSGAKATLTVDQNTHAITDITLDEQGSGYSSTPDIIIIDSEASFGYGATFNVTTNSGQIARVILTKVGTGYTSLPTVKVTDAIGNGTGAVLTPVLQPVSVTGVEVTTGGSGYTNPTVTISGGSGTGATAEAVVESGVLSDVKLYGSVKDITITNSGSGYIKEPSIKLSRGVGSIEVLTKGTGYSTAPTVTINGGDGKNAQAQAVISGSISAFTVISGGSGYTTIPTVTLVGDGQGATMEAKLSGAEITSTRVTNVGGGYTSATITTAPPLEGIPDWEYKNSLASGDIIKYSGNYYKSTDGGVLGSLQPTHLVGTQVTSQIWSSELPVTVGDSVYLEDRLYDVLLDGVTAVSTTPEHTISSPVASTALIAGFRYTITVVGTTNWTTVGAPVGYAVGTSFIATGTASGTGTATTTSAVNGGAILDYIGTPCNLLYVATDAVITPVLSTGGVSEITMDNQGTGYTTANVVFSAPPVGITATGTAVISGGQITGITIVNAGTGYSTPPTITITGDGSNAHATAIVYKSVVDVTLVNQGYGYQSPPTITVSAPQNGSSQATVTCEIGTSSVSEIVVTNGGDDYTSPEIHITGGGGSGAAASAVVNYDKVSRIVITNPGVGYTTKPTVSIGLPGEVGSGATAITYLEHGKYAEAKTKIYADKVISAFIVNSGFDYTSPPTVTIGDEFAAFEVALTDEQYFYNGLLYTVVAPGRFGTLQPTHTSQIQAVPTAPAWQALTEVVTGSTVHYGGYLYYVATGGITGNTNPTTTQYGQGESNGDATLMCYGPIATLRYAGKQAFASASLRYGAGYEYTPTYKITDTYGGTGGQIRQYVSRSEAKISTIVENGQIVYVIIEDPGVGYTKASLSVSGNGTGAVLIPDLSLGSVSSQQANNEILTPSGTIDAIAIVSGGFNYGNAIITITGDGTGATAVASFDPDTKAISKVTITNRGEGYTYANVEIIGNGVGASLRAIISPYGGHGKNCPEELYTRTLMFYSNISTDLNQGASVNNDYRQVGIIKDLRSFGGYEKFQGSLGSGCFLIQTPLYGEYTKFPKDSDLYVDVENLDGFEWVAKDKIDASMVGSFFYAENRLYYIKSMTLLDVNGNGTFGDTPPSKTVVGEVETNGDIVVQFIRYTTVKKRFRVISSSQQSVLVQSIDNYIPKQYDTFVKQNIIIDDNGNITTQTEDKFVAVDITLPSIDKFSGKMMYIDNKQRFTPSADETITIRTIVKF